MLDTRFNALKLILSVHDFNTWFLECVDLRGFTQEEVDALMEEIKPDHFPCVPLALEQGFDFLFVSNELANQLIELFK